MKSEDTAPVHDPIALAAQFQSIAEHCRNLMLGFLTRRPDGAQVGMNDPSSLGGAFLELTTRMMNDPAAVAAAQIDLFNESLNVWRHAAERMLQIENDDADQPKDKRFAHPDWTENLVFDFVKQSYLVASKALLSTVRDVEGLDDHTARKVDFYTRQFVDAMAPSNFVATNPEVLRTRPSRAGGENLRHGSLNICSTISSAARAG